MVMGSMVSGYQTFGPEYTEYWSTTMVATPRRLRPPSLIADVDKNPGYYHDYCNE